jgi:Prenyltransferase and squalene oxidase repeat
MTATLAAFWPALCHTLPPAWDTAANRDALERMARRMAPIPRIALEGRLADVRPRIDVQQCIRRQGGEPEVLRDFVWTTGDGRSPLGRFCAAWADPATDVHAGVAEVFLEYDVDAGGGIEPKPSVFFALDHADPATPAAAQPALELLVAPPRWLSDQLRQCFAACPPNARVAYIGAMIGRPAQELRVNVKGLHLADLEPFLEAVGWPGSRPAVRRWAAWAYDRADRVTVCLDVGSTIQPQLGLECMLSLQPAVEPRWEALLGELTTDERCSATNAGAFLSLPGVLHPHETPVPWPAPWIVATLRAPIDCFSTTERRLSHVKCTILGEDVSFKGYWGAGHVWRRRDRRGHEVVDEQGEARWPQARRVPASATATDRAVAFLLSRQPNSGRWSDFLLPAGPSDEWVTAFVGACLLEVPVQAARAAALHGWEALLMRRRDEPGWGYNGLTPPDADSTAWAIRLATGLGRERHPRVAAARAFLERHVVPGGVATYAQRGPIRAYTRLPEEASFAGWQAPHGCVTAAAAPILGAPAIDNLRERQTAAGCWQGYWWWDDEYTTALAAEAVVSARETAADWAGTRLTQDGCVRDRDGAPSPWATAWCARILRLGETAAAQEACTRAMRWLLNTQEEDGGWRGSARLRVPMPAEVDAAEGSRHLDVVDHERLFTTAAVTAALGMVGAGDRA